MGVARAVLRTTVRPVLGPPVPIRLQRAYLDLASARFPASRGTSVLPCQLGSRLAERVQAPGAAGPGAVLLLHGGAFITGSFRTHRAFAAHLSAAAGRPVHVLDYRLAPEHPYPAGVDDAQAAFDELVQHGPVTLVGDSAGGALALLLALRLRDGGGPRPDALGLVSPLVDLTLEHVDAYRGPDPLLRAAWAHQGTQAFVGGADARALSPLYADLSALPRTLVHVSQDECLRPEGEALVQELRSAGTPVESRLLRGLWHDPHLQAGVVAEATEAVQHLGGWLREAAAGAS